MSLQVPLPLSHTSRVSEWTSFELYAWITKHHEKFNLSQEDLDSIEESPLSGKQLLQKDDEQLSQEWAISIHAARKIVKKANTLQKKAEKRKSEPIINILNNGLSDSPLKNLALNNGNANIKASTNPSLKNIPEEQKMIDQSLPLNINYSSINQSVNPSYNSSLQETKLTLTIKNDTFMGRLSHPKWWMDGHFNYIPNKIGSKDSISIDITGDLETPLVGLMSFTLTLDPRYASKNNLSAYTTSKIGHAYSPYLQTSNLASTPNIPQWMIGPGGLPYIPPSVTKLYELQQEYVHKVMQTQKEKQQKRIQRDRKKRKRQERKRMKKQAKEQRLQIKREKRRIKREERRRQKEKEKEKDKDTEKENIIDDDSDGSIVEKDTDSDDDSQDSSSESDSEYSMSDLDDGDLEIDIEEPPKYRLIILWSIQPQKRDHKTGKTDRRDDIVRNSMMSVASSDLLNSMNRFNVLLLEDDTDPDKPDEFNLDNSYFSELEQASLIADIEQCLVDNENFEISATFGTNTGQLANSYTLQVDIDDSLGEWPVPLPQLNANNPFALGFIPTNIPLPMMINPYYNQYQQQQQLRQPQQLQPLQQPLINKQGSGPYDQTLIPPKFNNRSRSNSQPAPPVGISIDNDPQKQTSDTFKGPRSLSKMFTLSDVLSVSRSPIPEHTDSINNGYPNTNPNPSGFASYTQVRARRKNSHATKAPRLSLWKEQMNNLQQYQQQQKQQQLQGNNLYVPKPSQSPSMSPMPSLSPSVNNSNNNSDNIYSIQYNIGDCIMIDDSKLGQIKSIGQHPAWGKGTWYGIRLTEKIGNCDGEFKGIFFCVFYVKNFLNILSCSSFSLSMEDCFFFFFFIGADLNIFGLPFFCFLTLCSTRFALSNERFNLC